MIKTLLVFILAAASTIAVGQTYKWRDASGSIQYSDTPPPAGAKDVQQLRKASAVPQSSASSAPKGYVEQDAEFRKRVAARQEADTKQAKADDEERTRAKNCELAKSQLAALEAGARMVKLDSKGERQALDDAERDQAKMESKKAVDSWCK